MKTLDFILTDIAKELLFLRAHRQSRLLLQKSVWKDWKEIKIQWGNGNTAIKGIPDRVNIEIKNGEKYLIKVKDSCIIKEQIA